MLLQKVQIETKDYLKLYFHKLQKLWSFRSGQLMSEVGAVLPKDSQISLALESAKQKEGHLAEAPVSVISLVNDLICSAEKLGSSDIHIDPRETCLVVRFRVDGVLREVCRYDKKMQPELVSRVKVMAGMRTDDHSNTQEGRFRMNFGGSDGFADIRVSITPTYHGENVVLRILSTRNGEFSLQGLGFTQLNISKLRAAIGRPFGMILLAGPTGSGKTTTLYTLIKELNRPEVSIVTIEDPIEYAVEGLTQIQVSPKTNVTFAGGLKSVLRQDPDVIMVGEIRDPETASVSVNAALTGHLILSTLHASDAATILPRLLDLGVAPYLIASTVNLVVGQRLVRKICLNCKAEKPATPEELQICHDFLPSGDIGEIKNFYMGSGCGECSGTGFAGRIGIQEILVVDDLIREAVLKKASAEEIRALAIDAGGMPTMLEDGIKKAVLGITTLEEVLRVIYS